MIRIPELKAKRGDKIAAAKKILDAAEKEKRSLTSKEEEEWDILLAEAEGLEKLIEREEDRASLGSNHGGPPRPTPRGGSHPAVMQNSQGVEVRIFNNDQRFADQHRHSPVNGVPADELSLGRLIRAQASGNWAEAEPERRALGGSIPAGGATLLPDPFGTFLIDAARDSSVVSRAGARTVQMTAGTLAVPRVLSDPAPTWKAENATGVESEGTYDEVLLTARTLFAYTKMSRELLMDSPFAEDSIRNQLTQALGQELDRVALLGSGVAPEPLGLVNVPGIGAGTGGAINFGVFSIAVEDIRAANREANAVIHGVRTWGQLDRLQDADFNPRRPPQSYESLSKYVATKVPENLGAGTDESESFVGYWPEAAFGMRTGVELMVSMEASDGSGSAFTDYQVWVGAVLRADFVILRPASFVVVSGILP